MKNYKVEFPCLGGSRVSICVNAEDTQKAIYKAREIIEGRGIKLPSRPEQWARVIKEKSYGQKSTTR